MKARAEVGDAGTGSSAPTVSRRELLRARARGSALHGGVVRQSLQVDARIRPAIAASSFALAFVLRMLHIGVLADTPFFTGLIVDAAGYAQDALTIRREGVIVGGFYRPPLYAYVRAGLSLLGMGSPWAMAIAHACAGACTAALVSIASWNLFAQAAPSMRIRATWGAGIVSAAYGPWVIYDAEMLPAVWVHLLLALALALTTSGSPRFASRDLIIGACLGLAMVGWPPAVILAPLLMWLRARRVNRGRRLAPVLAIAICAVIAPALTALHNATEGAPGVVVSGNLGINLWLGNNANWRQTCSARPGLEYDREYQRPTRAGATTLPAREAFYLRAVADEWMRSPLSGLRRTAEKWYFFIHGHEIRRDQDLNWLRERSPVAAILMWEWIVAFPFGLILPLAFLCPVSSIGARQQLALIATVASYGVVMALFILGARYRLPIVLLLVPLASGAVAGACEAIRTRQVRTWVKAIGWQRWSAFVAAIVVCNLPVRYPAGFAASAAERLLLESQAHAASGAMTKALGPAREAVANAPDYDDARIQLGHLLLAAGYARPALRQFDLVTHRNRDLEGPWVLRAQALIALGDRAGAIASLQRALALNPFHPRAVRDLAGLLSADR